MKKTFNDLMFEIKLELNELNGLSESDSVSVQEVMRVVDTVVQNVSQFSVEQGKLGAVGMQLKHQSDLLRVIAADVGELGRAREDLNLVVISLATETCARSLHLWGAILNKLGPTAQIVRDFAFSEDGSFKDGISFLDLSMELQTKIQDHLSQLAVTETEGEVIN